MTTLDEVQELLAAAVQKKRVERALYWQLAATEQFSGGQDGKGEQE